MLTVTERTELIARYSVTATTDAIGIARDLDLTKEQAAAYLNALIERTHEAIKEQLSPRGHALNTAAAIGLIE